jgi:hypothetical protein
VLAKMPPEFREEEFHCLEEKPSLFKPSESGLQVPLNSFLKQEV